jgi:hypothetical protein
MFPYIGPEFIEALLFLATDKLATDRPPAAPRMHKSTDNGAVSRDMTLRLRFQAKAISKWIFYVVFIFP